jgi:hypothetical protein
MELLALLVVVALGVLTAALLLVLLLAMVVDTVVVVVVVNTIKMERITLLVLERAGVFALFGLATLVLFRQTVPAM